ncbi:hypothetical protein TNCV_1760511 [Trichonephila clavipes]|nr:hypothetical protein TNCV_1760511 [Trichonephila clavipes]
MDKSTPKFLLKRKIGIPYIPVREVIIMDEHGQRLRDVIGPYDEGSYVSLICEAEGEEILNLVNDNERALAYFNNIMFRSAYE